ncbi:isochorismate synthase [Lysinibacillus sphaericus]|uniref:isochorismate synthase n=1 Tax=Lysinibacillus sphaericus TaxID=1421 RepID=A0A2S5CWL5_LYSSH|nr:isochorismate synthase [Lysinibacillus sphaericus]OEC00313.1 isochorismate synthase [Lysinibacillus sphaericus]POZ55233.1 Salicylate biosynthesis isochorismate synthase [Lysinibacillus sphaericus]
MQQKWYQATEVEVDSLGQNLHFYMETIEVSRLSALAFYAAGEECYKGERFYWQNREKTMTLVGLGHAHTIQNNEKNNRFDAVEAEWKRLTKNCVKGQVELQPILFGGFTFDPQNNVDGEWTDFPEAYFALATYQLVLRDDKAYISIHLIANAAEADGQLEALRKERNHLIHAAQVKEVKMYAKPEITNYFEPYKDPYLASIDQVTALIKAKKADKVVIARSLALQFKEQVTSPQVLAQIIHEQPESYLFGLEWQDLLFFGASPERLVKVENGRAYSSCVAGSIQRGKTAEEDEAYGQSLLNDPKNGGEHQYVVDMIAETFRKNCVEMKIPDGPRLLKIRDIQHLFTPVEGQLNNEATILQLTKHLHPTPALGGVPRKEAMTAIRKYEPMNRGLYAAPIGWLDAEGNGEFAVAIRSAALLKDKAYLYAGGGIVADSEPQSEYEETLVKFRPMLRALGGQVHE